MAEGRPNVSQAQRPSECVTQGGDSCWSDTSVTEYSRGSSVIPPKWGHRSWPEGQAHGLSLHGPIQALAVDVVEFSHGQGCWPLGSPLCRQAQCCQC